jgi:hypothetical protein
MAEAAERLKAEDEQVLQTDSFECRLCGKAFHIPGFKKYVERPATQCR